jgi:four helix bundle protein
MGVRRFEDLAAWQLANELEDEVFAFTSHLPARQDSRFCDQIRESARSAPRNTAEGFGRYFHKESSRFLRFAMASLHETKNHFHEARDRRYLTDSEHTRLVRLVVRAIAANAGLLRHLDRTDPPEPFDPR